MWLAALCDTTAQYFEVVVVGLVLGPEAAGAFFVGYAYHQFFLNDLCQHSGLRHFERLTHPRTLSALAIIGVVFIVGGMLAILVGGKMLLWACGADYAAAYPELLVLAIGAAIAALSGPAAQVLLLTGHEGTYPRIMA